jgi:hypothetical protein
LVMSGVHMTLCRFQERIREIPELSRFNLQH